ncbi:Pre-rRNA-processing protein TSR2 [Giardia muris]|uniref:Pre-rRNA-processing protein TSR2 n=1 Tax=Giardia muris TaxID=5742 RepID=A0A4Z1T7B8_GIAMU|nr:Pre-rRNA-processing protein TSR2 [Giardia muris]|eukprot:TNJ29973.1 Pre-rRNA-processing protein TSR2 [Giardia muris]
MILTVDKSQLCRHRPSGRPSNLGCPDWPTFYAFICHLLSSWHALRAIFAADMLSIQQFTTCSSALAKEILEFFQEYGPSAEQEEIAAFLQQVLGDDFCTDLGDGSEVDVAAWLLQGYWALASCDNSLLLELQAAGLQLLPGLDYTEQRDVIRHAIPPKQEVWGSLCPLSTKTSGCGPLASGYVPFQQNQDCECVMICVSCRKPGLCSPEGICDDCRQDEYVDSDSMSSVELSDDLWL